MGMPTVPIRDIISDDFQDADGVTVIDYGHAQNAARASWRAELRCAVPCSIPTILRTPSKFPELPAVARTVGVTIEFIEVRDLGNLDAVTAQVMGANVQGLFVGIAPFWHLARTDITAMAARLKLPAVYGWREVADVGGLMSYGYNLPDMYRQSARLVDKILKGAKPGELPFELSHTLRTGREPQDCQGDGT